MACKSWYKSSPLSLVVDIVGVELVKKKRESVLGDRERKVGKREKKKEKNRVFFFYSLHKPLLSLTSDIHWSVELNGQLYKGGYLSIWPRDVGCIPYFGDYNCSPLSKRLDFIALHKPINPRQFDLISIKFLTSQKYFWYLIVQSPPLQHK